MRLITYQSTVIGPTKAEPSASEEAGVGQTREEAERLMGEIGLRWASLIRSNLSLLDLLEDPKLQQPNTILAEDAPRKLLLLLYIRTLPGSPETLATVRHRLRLLNPAGDLDLLEIRELPADNSFPSLNDHGALYLPYPYVVPGGRFQEMYAWDSFFIALGLLRDNQTRLARNMLDNYIYQIEHYGTILNGNRTYYLTRSQLPFLTPLIKRVLPRSTIIIGPPGPISHPPPASVASLTSDPPEALPLKSYMKTIPRTEPPLIIVSRNSSGNIIITGSLIMTYRNIITMRPTN